LIDNAALTVTGPEGRLIGGKLDIIRPTCAGTG
jgi:hypothetical protein